MLICLCVVMISAGQILFRMAGLHISGLNGFLFSKGFWLAAAGIFIYTIATLLWIYLLRTIPLSVAYPFMALSYACVPLAAWMIFSETISPTYMAGIGLIMLGVTLTAIR